jgi:RimJ/RimL family protein N-acetyltransferase
MTPRTSPDSWRDLLRDPNPWSRPDPLPGAVETERLLIRPYEPADAGALFEAIDRSREALLPWMVWTLSDHQTEADSAYYIEHGRRSAEKPDCTDFSLGIFERPTGRFLGGTGFHRIEPGVRDVEIGFWLRPDAQGRGLCTEAIGALISSAFVAQSDGGWGFRRVHLFCGTENTTSRRVMERLGLRLEQRTRQDRYLDTLTHGGATGYHDNLGYAVLADEWDPLTHRARPGIGWPD